MTNGDTLIMEDDSNDRPNRLPVSAYSACETESRDFLSPYQGDVGVVSPQLNGLSPLTTLRLGDAVCAGPTVTSPCHVTPHRVASSNNPAVRFVGI